MVQRIRWLLLKRQPQKMDQKKNPTQIVAHNPNSGHKFSFVENCGRLAGGSDKLHFVGGGESGGGENAAGATTTARADETPEKKLLLGHNE